MTYLPSDPVADFIDDLAQGPLLFNPCRPTYQGVQKQAKAKANKKFDVATSKEFEVSSRLRMRL